ncbi:AAA family ATPase [Pseudoruegeria sp. HB172150]|uniref:AAA family ATPase n=1 Tax=Pseudoruegeria sp. HB172150 TaxID=2721164 RepID=UPI001C12D711|nr:AAA family ATPase [Pseudoruegeria sp. HB172150]
MSALLVALAGLPGVGKTTISRAASAEVGAVYLRIDSIERGLTTSSLRLKDVADAGYAAAMAVAQDNLCGDTVVITDSVNPLPATRAAWRAVAAHAEAAILEVEVICSDRDLHRKRVEARAASRQELTVPHWPQVAARDYRPYPGAHLVLDTAKLAPDDAIAALVEAIRARCT